MKIKIGKYYVYTHSINGEVFYIGKGINSRAFDFSRSKEWKEHTENSDEIDVNIIEYFNSEKEAFCFERFWIKSSYLENKFLVNKSEYNECRTLLEIELLDSTQIIGGDIIGLNMTQVFKNYKDLSHPIFKEIIASINEFITIKNIKVSNISHYRGQMNNVLNSILIKHGVKKTNVSVELLHKLGVIVSASKKENWELVALYRYMHDLEFRKRCDTVDKKYRKESPFGIIGRIELSNIMIMKDCIVELNKLRDIIYVSKDEIYFKSNSYNPNKLSDECEEEIAKRKLISSENIYKNYDLSEYDRKIMTYDIERKIIKEVGLTGRKDVRDMFQYQGYFLNWKEEYNKQGYKIYIPSKGGRIQLIK